MTSPQRPSLRTRFYRDKINGKFMGVCAGIADYTGLEVLWIRVGMVVLTLCGVGFLPVLYFALGFMAPVKPGHLYADREEQAFWQGVRQSPGRTAREVRARFRDIGPIVGTVTQLAFFVSPVLWKPELLHDRQVWLVLNPVYDVMEVVRGPLLGQSPSLLIWFAAIAITAIVCAMSLAFFVRFRGRIAFWV